MRTLFFFVGLAVILPTTVASAQSEELIHLDQGWSAEEREEFYFTAQGSQLIPYEWFLHLEQADSEELFRSNANLAGFGFLTTEPSNRNPEGLPIGFVRDGEDPVATESLEQEALAVLSRTTRFEVKKAFLGESFDEKFYPREKKSWFGFTCAACHTHEIQYQGKTVRIDGGAAQADVESFLRELGEALAATCYDSGKLKRFAERVGRKGYVTRDFKKEVQQISDAVNSLVQRNKADHPYGHARLDAFGAILNAVCETALGEPDNHRKSNAPVSYPTLWNTPDYSFVQWNASAQFAEARNVGEVLGVFGTYTLEPGDTQFDSTVHLKNLIRLEHDLIEKLTSPVWPEEVFGKLDDDKVGLGRKLFKQNCQSCHASRVDGNFVRNDQGRIPVTSVGPREIKTDPQFLINLNPMDRVKTGILKDLFQGVETVPRSTMLTTVVPKIIVNRIRAERIANPPTPPVGQAEPQPAGIGRGYLSRPLEGIWTSAPYFHNGSVPNLYETLLPAAERSTEFWVGTTEFDPVNVGFVTTQSPGAFKFRVVDESGMPITGNLNSGHEGHGANPSEGFTQTFENGEWRDFTEKERYALVEYMKSLSPVSGADDGDDDGDAPDATVEFEVIPDGEEEMIANIVQATAEQLRMRYGKDRRVLRGVHPKDHGCVTATFKVNDDLPENLTAGIFRPGATYDSYIRFSNAAVRVGPDSTRGEDGKPVHGSRGMAIKLTGVQGDSLLPVHGALTQDFLMINQPAFAFANVEDYELLSKVLVEHNDQAGKFFEKRFAEGTDEQKARAARTGQIVQRIRANEAGEGTGAFFPPPGSPVDNPYFSAAPFLFGPNRVMQFRAQPIDPGSDAPNVDDPNYLRTALIERLSTESKEPNPPVVFDFGIQVRTIDQVQRETDIENASVEWEGEFTSVAKITIHPQDFDSPEQRVHCEKLFFTPWHGITDHKPIGGINRLRKAVYLESAKIRNLPKEPPMVPSGF